MFNVIKTLEGFVIPLLKEGSCPTRLIKNHCMITVMFDQKIEHTLGFLKSVPPPLIFFQKFFHPNPQPPALIRIPPYSY